MLRDIAMRDPGHAKEPMHGNWGSGACFLSLCTACGIPWLAPELSGVASTVLLYVLLATGLSLEFRLAGLPDLNYASWFAIGAYSSGLLAHYSGLPFWACLPFAAFLAAAVAVLIVTRLLQWRIELFGPLTFGLGVALQNVLTHWTPPPVLVFPAIPANLEYWSLVLAAVVAALVSHGVGRSPLARMLRAARQDEIVCHSLGLDIRFCRLAVVALGAGLAGAAGCLFAAGRGSIGPADFDLNACAILFAIAVLGGRHGPFGIIVAALAFAAILRLFPAASDYRLFICGAALVCWAIWRAIAKNNFSPAEQSAEHLTPAEVAAE